MKLAFENFLEKTQLAVSQEKNSFRSKSNLFAISATLAEWDKTRTDPGKNNYIWNFCEL